MRFRRERRSVRLPGPLHVDLAPGAAQIVRNLLITHDGVIWAGYRLGGARWDFTAEVDKSLLLEAATDVWAHLLGRQVQERVTTRPHPVTDWAANLDARTPSPIGPLGDWNRHLARQQFRIAQAGMDDKIVYRSFVVGAVEPGTGIDVMAQVRAFYRDGTAPSESVKAALAVEKRLFDAVQAPGWNARRMRERDSGWLRMRSLAPGVPAPLIDTPGWDSADMGFFSGDVRWEETPLDRTVKVTAWRGGQAIVRHVQVLTCARMGDLVYPESNLEPWQAYVERALDPEGLSFPVEWNIVGHLREGSELASRASLDLGKAESIAASYAAFEERPPEYTERGIDVALQARDQISTGRPAQAGRFTGTLNLLVWGEDVTVEGRVVRPAAEVCEERAEAVRRLYAGADLRMDLAVPAGQAGKLREFVPGEPFDRDGYQRQIRLPYLAAGLPNVSATVGDGRGPYLGFTRGTARRPVMHDPHFATEGRGELGRGQNFWLVVASLGGGKSVLLASIIYNAVRRRIITVVRDPSGPLARLCQMPELAPYSQVIDLLKGQRGILNPPSLVREPSVEEFYTGDFLADAGAHEEAAAEARAERRGLVIDMARRCLDFDLYDHPRTVAVLREAADDVAQGATGWTIDSSLWDLVEALRGIGDPHADAVATSLRSAAEMPLLRLLFPPLVDGGVVPVQAMHLDKVLTVITTPGIKRAPDSVPRSDWNARDIGADVVLRLTSLFTDRLLFSKSMGERAVAAFDEAEDMTDYTSGRSYFARLGRDHSKWNIAVYLGLKNVTDEMLGGELRNFLAGAFVGRMANEKPAQSILSILNVTDLRYARTLMSLSTHQPGEFVHLDAEGNVGGIKIDVDYYPDLRKAVLTNPQNEGSAAWALAEEAMV